MKYPSIPCYVDKTTTIYPLKGSSFITGPEYNLALRQGCNIEVKSAFYISSPGGKEKLVKLISLEQSNTSILL